MATLTPTFTLTSTDITSDELSFSKTDTLTANGSVEFKRLDLDGTNTKLILDASALAASYVWLYNTDGSQTITIGEDAAEAAEAMDSTHLTLAPYEFAWLPWDSTVDLYADTSSACKLEIGIFEKS